MNLKTNFKNDKFSGLRKYKMTTDTSTGLTTLEDKTEYQEIGDIFSADDINETNKAVLQNNSEIQDIKGIKKIMVPSPFPFAHLVSSSSSSVRRFALFLEQSAISNRTL